MRENAFQDVSLMGKLFPYGDEILFLIFILYQKKLFEVSF